MNAKSKSTWTSPFFRNEIALTSVTYPTKLATNSMSVENSPLIRNRPAASVAEPMVVLLTKTLAKGSGRPEPFSRTVPVIVCEKQDK